MNHIAPGRRVKSTGNKIIVGFITVAPLAVTWIIVDFLFRQLSQVGRPWVNAITRALGSDYSEMAAWLQNETFLSIVAAVVVLTLLWALGWMTTRVIGQRLIDLFEGVIGLIPFVDKIYRATKRFLKVAGSSPEGEQRVVLINFPSPDMKAIGLVTHILTDKDSGEKLAAVYVPTAPNPTSGYIEIVPLTEVVYTDWTFDEAMSFIVTGGSQAPDTITFRRRPGPLVGGA